MASQSPAYLANLTTSTLPPTLWRIQHDGSTASFNSNRDLQAAISDHVPQNEEQFRYLLRQHLLWEHSTVDSPLLSVFDSRDEAVAWGETRYHFANDTESKVALYAIDSASLGHRLVFKLDDLKSRFKLPVNRDISREYLLLNRVPAQAIHLDMDISGTIYAQTHGTARGSRDRAYNPAYHWVADLHGWYDTDEECEEHNLQDDLMNMLDL